MVNDAFWCDAIVVVMIAYQFLSVLISKLSTMGNGNSGVDFAINLDKDFYFSSEVVKGHLFVNAKKRYPAYKIMIEIIGTEACEFRNQEGQNLKEQKQLFHTTYPLVEFGHNQFLEGQHDFPFSFRFLEYLPGTFEENKNYKAKICYTIKAVILSKDRKLQTLEKSMEIVIRQPQRQGQKMLQGETFANCQSCFCLDKGVSRIFCYFDKNYYLPGQDCIMICQVDNIRCGLSISRIKCQFMKEVVLTTSNGQSKTFTEHINTVFFPGVVAKGAYFGNNAERETIKLIYKDSQTIIKPSTHGRLVRCQYYILVEPLFSGCGNSIRGGQFKVYLTILQPPNHIEAIPRPEDWRPSIAANSNIYLNFDPSSSNENLTSMSNPYQ